MLKANNAAQSAEFVNRVKNFVDHPQRSNHVNQEQHSQQEDLLEAAFEVGQDESVFQCFIICARSLLSCSNLHGKIPQKELSGKLNTISIAN
eukprot:717305-Karenia_brevis.AAC.1